MPGHYEVMQTNPLALNRLRFEPLGYMTFDTNEKTNFKVREMKSAYFSEASRADAMLLLKLVIHGYHMNKLNLFNQVSLIALNCLGHTYTVNPSFTESQLSPLMPMQHMNTS